MATKRNNKQRRHAMKQCVRAMTVLVKSAHTPPVTMKSARRRAVKICKTTQRYG